MLGPSGSAGSSVRREDELLAPRLRFCSEGGISPGFRVASIGLRGEDVPGFGRVGGGGLSFLRCFASGSSIERPSASTCSVRALRASSSSSAGSTVTCTNPRARVIPTDTLGSPTASSGGSSPKAVRRTPSTFLITNGSSSVPAICWAPSAV